MALVGSPRGTNLEGLRRLYMRVDSVYTDKANHRTVVSVGHYVSKQSAAAGEPALLTMNHEVRDTSPVVVDWNEGPVDEGGNPVRTPIFSEPGTEWSDWFGPKHYKKDQFEQAYTWLKTLPTFEGVEDDR
jgi:hypothetical protein